MIKNKDQSRIATHKVTDTKIEVYSLFSADKDRNNVDQVYWNVHNKLGLPTVTQLNRTKHRYPFMSAVKKKQGNMKFSEGLKKFTSHKKSIALFRTYKIVGTNYIKAEVTICGEKRNREKNIKKAYDVLSRATEGVEQSLLPYYVQNGFKFFPLDDFFKNKYS